MTVIIVGSITYAMKGQKILEKYGIASYIARNTDDIAQYGCGYNLKVYYNARQAIEILQQSGIKIRAVIEGVNE
ncbi:MAG TPA: DUF3343 domain-containing protein [Ruminococcaceae bacterium]|nr:DUF3343 domain-containing protein [Oscillospiraceae bacterium]